jgi:uncharacterized membrane protein (UPF0127 family)
VIAHPAPFALALVIALQSTSAKACDQNNIDIDTISGLQTIHVEIADDTKERARGLSGRETLDDGTGMLFLYDTPHRARFWMMGTTVALDMIFIEQDGRISAVRKDVQPGTLWPVNGGKSVIAVLEINAGEAKQRSIQAGDYAINPAFGC